VSVGRSGVTSRGSPRFGVKVREGLVIVSA